MGTYGILRIIYPILPAATLDSAVYLLIALGPWNLVYGALCAMAQTDFKKLIAYSSISHMGYVMFGMATMTSEGINGAVLQMFNHGTVTAMLFLLVGVIYDRAHHREINGIGGLAGIMPFYTGWTALAFFAAMGLPGLSAFISEVLVLLGGWRSYPMLTIVSASAVVLTAGYMLWTMQRIYLGPPNEKYVGLPDINGREVFTLVPLGIIVIILGVYPRPVLDLINVSLTHLNQVVAGKAQVALATASRMVP
jgi:NADH-quinone oxidoreductase subunit M